MGFTNLITKNHYDFYEASSALQKSIRRADTKVAGFFALELFSSGYQKYVWKRLYTISAEDCYGLITHEIESLHRGYLIANDDNNGPKGRIFISKAVVLLCDVRKNRDADHLQCIIVDQRRENVEKWIEEVRRDPLPIPEYAYDVHTRRGKKMGKTKTQFFREELEALKPRQLGLFDNLV